MTGHRPLEQHRAFDVVVHAHHAAPIECVENRARAPFIPKLLNNLQHDWPTVAVTEDQNRGFCFGCTLNVNAPGADAIGDPEREVRTFEIA